jgi:hypothetical protein
MAQVPRDGTADDGLAPKGRNPGDRRRGEDRDHQVGDRAPLDRMKLPSRCRRRWRRAGYPAIALHRRQGPPPLATNTSSIGGSIEDVPIRYSPSSASAGL